MFHPVITPDGSKIVAAAWTGSLVAELAEFSARTGRLIAVLMPAAHLPGHGSPGARSCGPIPRGDEYHGSTEAAASM